MNPARVTVTADNVPNGISKADHDAGMRSSLENLTAFVERRSVRPEVRSFLQTSLNAGMNGRSFGEARRHARQTENPTGEPLRSRVLSLKRLERSRLIDAQTGRPRLKAVEEFLIHGVKYASRSSAARRRAACRRRTPLLR